MKRSAKWSFTIPVILLSTAITSEAQDKTYSGEITAVDNAARTFSVKGAAGAQPAELKFHVAPSIQVMVDGEVKLFAELEKGDEVTVSYRSAGEKATAHRAVRTKTAAKEMTFEGQVVAVDPKANTLTVKRTTGGAVEEKKFLCKPGSRFYLAGEEVLLASLAPGDPVTVSYVVDGDESRVKHVTKTKTS